MGTEEKENRLRMSSTFLKTDADETAEAQALQTTPNSVGNTADTSEGEKKGDIFKKNVIKKGKDSVFGFVISKVVTAILSAVLSAIMVLVAQYVFKDDIKDYRKDFFIEIKPDLDELLDFVYEVDDKDMSYDEILEYFEENDIQEKSKNLLEKAITYSAENKDVNELHGQLTDICKDIHRLSYKIYYASDNHEDIIVEYKTSMQVIEDKVDIFAETKSRLWEKYHIKDDDLK